MNFSYSLDGTTVTNNQGNWYATFINGYLPTHALSELCIENPANGMYIGIAIDSYLPENGICHTDIVAWYTASSYWCNGTTNKIIKVTKAPSVRHLLHVLLVFKWILQYSWKQFILDILQRFQDWSVGGDGPPERDAQRAREAPRETPTEAERKPPERKNGERERTTSNDI